MDQAPKDVPSGSVVLRKGRVRPIHSGHPWVFAGAVSNVVGQPEAGDPVWVVDPDKKVLGWGVFSPNSGFRVRMWGYDQSSEGVSVNRTIELRIRQALERRVRLGIPSGDTNAYRLINAEGDRLPGLTVDVLGDVASVRHGSAALWSRRKLVAQLLRDILSLNDVVHRVDDQVADLEQIYGIEHVDGDSDRTEYVACFQENGIQYEVDLLRSQKTGHYLDQQVNRARLATLCKGANVLDLCTSTGGFALNAAKAGARRVLGVDSSKVMVEYAKKNAALNNLNNIEFMAEDAIRVCRTFPPNSFDIVVLDPPKLVKSKKAQVQGLKKYEAMNTAALRLVTDEGLFMSYSCSGHVDGSMFSRMLTDVARKTGRILHVHEDLGAGMDHPVVTAAPEGRYLKGILGAVSSR